MSPSGSPTWRCARRGGRARMVPQRGATRRSRADRDCVNCRRATLIAVGVEDAEMLCSPRGGGGPAHAPAARHTVEVARGRGRRRRPGAHAEGRGRRGRGDARSHPRGDADGRCWRGCYRGRRALRLLPPCLWPPTRLRRRDGAECRPRGVQHGAVRAAGGCRACSSFIISKEGGKGVASQLVKNLVETSHLSTLAFSGSIL